MSIYEYKNIKPYLATQSKENEKQLVWGNILLLVVFTPLIYLVDLIEQADKIKMVLALIFCTVAVVMVIWSIYLILTFESHKNGFTLYQGAISIAYSLIFMGTSIKFNYIACHNKLSVLYIMFCVLSNLIIISILMGTLNKNLKTDYYLKRREINKKGLATIIGTAGLGIIVSRVMRGFIGYDTNMQAISIDMLILSYMFQLGSHNVYKYMLLREYIEHNKKG